jgi:predicted amidohydrolase
VVSESEVTGVIPGNELPVFETDFGPVGILICFDIGWHETWRALAEKGAKMVVWQSAYDGGFLLNAYAALNVYYVVSKGV